MNKTALLILAGLGLYFWSRQSQGSISAETYDTGPSDSPDSSSGSLTDSILSVTYPVEAALQQFTGGAMQVSQQGVQAVMTREQLMLSVYSDVGKPAIGYGHDLLPGESYPNGIDAATAMSLLSSDMQKAADAVNILVTVPLTQNQFDALCSFVFNIGSGAFRKSTLLELLNSGDYAGAADQFGRWVYAGIGGKKVVSAALQSRRGDEQAQFMS